MNRKASLKTRRAAWAGEDVFDLSRSILIHCVVDTGGLLADPLRLDEGRLSNTPVSEASLEYLYAQ
jgi:hypothetical protein